MNYPFIQIKFINIYNDCYYIGKNIYKSNISLYGKYIFKKHHNDINWIKINEIIAFYQANVKIIQIYNTFNEVLIDFPELMLL